MLSWRKANAAGKLIDRGRNGWLGGHCNDLLEVDDTLVVAASATSGVWLLGVGVGVPLSLDWSEVDTAALAFGPLGRTHLLVGGGTSDGRGWLRQTNAGLPNPLSAAWSPIALPSQVGAIRRIVVDPVNQQMILATTQGLWHGPVPPVGAAGAASLSAVGGTDASVDWFDVALTADRGCVAVTVGASMTADPGRGFFVGRWHDAAGSLTLTRVDAGAAAGQFFFTRLAVAPSDPRIVYAAGSDNDDPPPGGAAGTFRGLLRSLDGGQTWIPRGARGTGGRMIADHSTRGYSGAMAVSPSDHETLALGHTDGYISRNGGDDFALFGDQTHDDKHAYRFGAGGRLWEASDGGIAFTDDLAAHCHTHLNAQLANLQFMGPGTGGLTTGAGASRGTSGLIGGGLQDNGTTYCRWLPDHSASPWFSLNDDVDGQTVCFLATGQVLWAFGGVSYTAPYGATDPLSSTPIPVRHANPARSNPPTTLNGVFAAVPEPVGDHDRLALALLVSGADLYGLFDSGGLGWEFLGTLPLQAGETVTDVATMSGSTILVGVSGTGAIYVVDPNDVAAATRSTVSAGSQAAIYSIVILSEAPALTAVAAAFDPALTWQLFSTTNGTAWTPTSWPVNRRLIAVAVGTDDPTSTLYAASPSEVFVSYNTGSTWHSESSGLPAQANCSDLVCVANPDGVTRLYLSTWGWSMWEADVAWVTASIRQTTDREPCADIFPATDVVEGETATFEAVMHFHGPTGPVASYTWTTTGGGVLHPDGPRVSLEVGTTLGPFTIDLTVEMSDGRTLTTQRQLNVISLQQAHWIEIACLLAHYSERIQRIPPIIILNRLGPDPAPLELKAELDAARHEFSRIERAVDRARTAKRPAKEPSPAEPSER